MEEKLSFAVLYLAESLIAWLYCEHQFGNRRKRFTTALSFAVGYSLLFGLYWLGIAVLNVVSFFIVNAVLLCVNFGCGVKAAALHAIFLGLMMFGAETITALVISLFGYEYAPYSYNYSAMTPLTVMSRQLYLILSFIGARLFTPHGRKPEEPRIMALFLGLSLLSLLMSVLMTYLGSFMGLTGTTESMVVRNIFALLIVNLFFLVIYDHLQKASASRLSPEQSRQQESSYYSELQEQYDNQRRLIHDIKNHLRAIEGLAVEGNATEVVSYISELEGRLAPMSPVRLSSDPVLNAILVRFGRDCQDKGVAFVSDLRDGGIAFMDAPEITTFYGNLLSNASEAAGDSAERAVELSVVHNAGQGVLLVSVINSCDTPPRKNAAGRMLSRKRGFRAQGVGLRSIERVVRKYRGVETMYYDAESRRFHHIIQFPVTQ